ncbi:Holliday junction resolvase [compost metagenome]
MNILFCDQSLLRFGFCIINASTQSCILKKYGLLKLNGKISYFERLTQIKNWLIKLIEEHHIEQVIIEE